MNREENGGRRFDVLSILVRRIIDELIGSGKTLKEIAKILGLTSVDVTRLRKPDTYDLGIRPERALRAIIRHWGLVMNEQEMADLIELIMRNPELKDLLIIMKSDREDIKEHLSRQMRILARAVNDKE